MNLNELRWPLYLLGKHSKVWEEEGITYIDTDYGQSILDNKNITGNSLGIRRLKLSEYKLYRLKVVVHTLSELVSIRSTHPVFIDSNGMLFHYSKSVRRSLIYKKVEHITVQDSKLLCYCKDIFRPIEVSYIPRIMPRFLGLLVVQGDYLLYSLEATRLKDTWRKI